MSIMLKAAVISLSGVLPLLLNDSSRLPPGHAWKWRCKLFLLYAR